jgi:hypothetical protein
MAQQVQHTETSTIIKATKVADYIVERIAAEGISHCFGVAGDYVFPICDAVDSSPNVKVDRLCQRVERVLCGGRLRPHSRRGNAGDNLGQSPSLWTLPLGLQFPPRRPAA